MKLQYLNCDDVITYYEELNQMLHFCIESSCPFPVEESFYERKLAGLQDYLSQEKAYVIGAIEDGRLLGFYWIYELREGVRRKMHVAYGAVMPDSRGRGIFNILEAEAERKARELGISDMELIVSLRNSDVIKIHEKSHGYSVTNVIMEKDISV